MNRADITAHLDANMPDVKTVATLATWDSVIDATLRMLNVAEADLATWNDATANGAIVRPLSEWLAIDRALNTLQFKAAFSVGNPSTSKQANQMFEMATRRQRQLGDRLAVFGVSPDGMYGAEIILNWRATDPALAEGV